METHSFSAMALLTVTPDPSGSRVGHGHGDALRFGCGGAFVHLAVSRGAVGSEHALLGANVTLLAIPPHSVQCVRSRPRQTNDVL